MHSLQHQACPSPISFSESPWIIHKDRATNSTKRHTVSNPKQKIKYQRPYHQFNSVVFYIVQFHGPQNALSDVILDPTSHAPLGLRIQIVTVGAQSHREIGMADWVSNKKIYISGFALVKKQSNIKKRNWQNCKCNFFFSL
ncbi:hypothetical protein PRUPE_3G147700 [Prunus persica]|uniref:Uncharacterized protein n=1 Tax=Prunus persica TaxID=3760 RepID=A0A251Q3J1_PRUPE|nr:hypothetical protein PRUPE_3G147700 [Prunus persica]